MAGKPLLPLPVWCTTDGDYTAPGKPWDSQPTKSDPGDGLRASGYDPNTRPPAEETNFHLNKLGKWVAYFENMQVRNFIPASNIVVFLTDVLVYHSSTGNWVSLTAGSAGGMRSYDLEYWFVIDAPEMTAATGDWRAGYDAGSTGAGFVTDDDEVYEYDTDGNWTKYSPAGLTGFTNYSAIIYDPYNDRWLVGGTDGANPEIAYSGAGDLSVFTMVVLDAQTYGANLSAFATSNTSGAQGITVGLCSDDAGTHIYTSTDSVNWTMRTEALFDKGREVDYSPELGVFLSADENGYAWTSSDGISWSISSATFSGTIGIEAVMSVIANGGQFVVVWKSNSGDDVRWQLSHTSDMGTTWETIDLVQESVNDHDLGVFVYGDKMFVYTHKQDVNEYRFLKSLRLSQ